MTPIQITTVRYERLKNLGNYENEKVCLEAIVGPDQTAAEVYGHLAAEANALLNPPRPNERGLESSRPW